MAKTETNGKVRYPILGGNDDMEMFAVRKARYAEGAPAQLITHARQVHDNRARLAMDCMARWAMICGEADGEDSRGRQKMRRMTPAELVSHACAVAEAADKEFKARGWVFDVGSYADAVDAVKDIEDAND